MEEFDEQQIRNSCRFIQKSEASKKCVSHTRMLGEKPPSAVALHKYRKRVASVQIRTQIKAHKFITIHLAPNEFKRFIYIDIFNGIPSIFHFPFCFDSFGIEFHPS